MGLLICTQIGLILSVFGFISMILGRRVIPTHGPGATVFAVFVAVAVTAFNYYKVRYENKWKQFEREF